MPNIDCALMAWTSGIPCSAVTSGNVTWSSTSLGERPIHSVKTMTWFSERSGIASKEVVRTDQTPKARTTV